MIMLEEWDICTYFPQDIVNIGLNLLKKFHNKLLQQILHELEKDREVYRSKLNGKKYYIYKFSGLTKVELYKKCAWFTLTFKNDRLTYIGINGNCFARRNGCS
jgi:hypothetical protein